MYGGMCGCADKHSRRRGWGGLVRLYSWLQAERMQIYRETWIRGYVNTKVDGKREGRVDGQRDREGDRQTYRQKPRNSLDSTMTGTQSLSDVMEKNSISN